MKIWKVLTLSAFVSSSAYLSSQTYDTTILVIGVDTSNLVASKGYVDNKHDQALSAIADTAGDIRAAISAIPSSNIYTANGTLAGARTVSNGGFDLQLPELMLKSSGNVGIGTTTPSAKLEVSGRISQIGIGNSTFVGFEAGLNDDLNNNQNIAIGYQALYSNTTGYRNTANGFQVLYSNTTGFANTANGYQALVSNTEGYQNTANGFDALRANTTGYQNTANGYQSLYSNTTGFANTANGLQALYSNTTGYRNTANGLQALYSNTIGYQNTANGFQALVLNTEGYQNTANGFEALRENTTGIRNTANGYQALFSNTTGAQNTAIGHLAGRYILGGSPNEVTNNSIFIGLDTRANASGETNQTVIGHTAQGIGSNTVVIGNDAVTKTALKGNVGIGTTTPGAKLDVNGSVRFQDYGLGNFSKSGAYSRLLGTDLADGDIVDNTNIYTDGTNVGIGTTTPAAQLHTTGTVRLAGIATTGTITKHLGLDASKNLIEITPIQNTDAQTLSLATNTLSISGGNNVSLASYLDNTDAQTLTLATNSLSISGGNNVSLAAYLDNTDAQTLALSTNTLSISGGNNVSLAPYLDNTDAQTLTLATNSLSISNGNNVSLAAYLDNTDAQTLTLSSNTLSISGGNNVSLASYLDNTDAQTWSQNMTTKGAETLTLSGGNTATWQRNDGFGMILAGYNTDMANGTHEHVVTHQNVGLTPKAIKLNCPSGAGTFTLAVAIKGTTIHTQTSATGRNTYTITGASAIGADPYATYTISAVSGSVKGCSVGINTSNY